MTQTALFHTNIDSLQVLAYSTSAEVQDQARRILLATTSNGLDISFGMGVVLARDMARCLQLACDSPHRPNLDRFDDRCLEFFGQTQGGYVSRDNEPDPDQKLPSIRLALCGGNGKDQPRVVIAMPEARARALSAALLSATESIISETTVAMAKQMPPSYQECRKQRQPDGWPGDADDIAAAAERDALLTDTLGATRVSTPAAAVGNGGW